MTKNQFKKSINAEMLNAGITRKVKEVKDLNVNTILVFEDGIDMRTLKWLNNRFAYGIHIIKKEPTNVYLNTPLQERVEI